MSGKVMQDAVPPAGTALKVTWRIEESGHMLKVAASLLGLGLALAAPKREPDVIPLPLRCK